MQYKKIFFYYLAIANIAIAQPIYRNTAIELQANPNNVDLKEVSGKWYEIYRLPNHFEHTQCNDLVTEESLSTELQITNSCIDNTHTGVAYAKNTPIDSKYKVSFLRPFYAEFWILDIDSNYSWAIVGDPKGKYLWILSRTPQMSEQLKNTLLQKTTAMGYPESSLETVKDF